MKSTFYPVHAALKDFVHHIMVVEAWIDHKAAQPYIPFPPTPQNNINFYPADAMHTRKVGQNFARSPDAIIIGPQTKRVDLAAGKHHVIVSVCFHPGGMFRLLKVPMYELMDEPYNATDLLGKEMNEVNHRLKETGNLWEMKVIVENYLLSKLRYATTSPFDKAMKLMLHQQHFKSIDEVAAASCISNRQFERRCKDIIGYSPKFFARIIRFSKAYRTKINNPNLPWGQIAYKCGYYDQMHLIKDFKEFTDTNPGLLNKEISLSPIQVQKNIGL